MSFVLAIDQGTTSSRAIVFRSDISIAAVAQQETAILLNDFRMLARDVSADDLQVGGRAPADQKQRPVEHDDPSALRVTDVEARFAHELVERPSDF